MTEERQACRRCGARLARDNEGDECSLCRHSPDRLAVAPDVPESFWRGGEIQAALADRHMGRLIRAYRRHPHHGHRGLNQELVAGWLGLTQAQLIRIENGPPIAHIDRLVHCATVLGIPPQYLWFALPGRGFASPGPVDDAVIEELDDLAQVTERIRRLEASNVEDGTLARLDRLIGGYAQAYEEAGGTSLYRIVLRQRRTLDDLLGGHHSAAHRARLFELAAKLSVILAHLAFDLGRDSLAETHGVEAFTLADLAGDDDLSAHVRGTQSFMAYYRHRYPDALQLARDGANRAGNRAPAVRLAVHEARAQARLWDAPGVDRAVARAFELRLSIDASDTPHPFLSFAPYDTSRIAGNAATAYLSLGRAAEVRRYADVAVTVLEGRDARAGKALTKLDAASSYLLDRSAEPEHAAVLAGEAVGTASGLPSAVIARRATEFLQAARRWSRVPEVAAVSEEVADWRRQLPQPGAGTKELA